MLAATIGQVQAGVVISTNAADFNLTSVGFDPVLSSVTTDLVSTDASVTLAIAFEGDPATQGHYYSPWTGMLPGNEYALDGDENFDIKFTAHQSAFAMDYLDTSIESKFSLTFYDGAINVGETSFITNSFGTAQFIGFISSLSFDKVTVREDDGSENSDEFFQFYSATSAAAVPEPSSIVMFGVGAIGMAFARRKRKQRTQAA